MIVGTSALVALVTGAPGHERLLDALLADPDPVLPATLDLVVGEARLRIVPFGAAEAALARAAFDRTAGLGDCVAEAAALATGVALLDAGDAR